jgi:hypothetical protein
VVGLKKSKIGNLESGHLESRNRTIPASQSRNSKAQIGRSDGSSFRQILGWEVYDFCFVMQESSDFKIPDVLIPDFQVSDFFTQHETEK